jgi:hypothetical protein
MKKVLILAIVSLFLVFLATQVSAATCTTTVLAGGDIQAAINGAFPGDVICLDPGVYALTATINVNKSVTISGPQAGVDPRPSFGSTRNPADSGTEAVVKGSITLFNIAANNVEINGLTMESSINNSGWNIVEEDNNASFYSDGAKVLYNIIHNTNYPGGTMNEAVKIRTGTNARIAFNYIYNIPSPGDGINFDGMTNGTIEHNELHDQGSVNAAIYVYNSTNTTIKCNLVYNTLANEAIKLGTAGAGDPLLFGGQIVGNVVHNTAQDGIAIYTSHVLVESNEVYNSTSENGAIYVAYAVSDITITNNFVHNNTLNTVKWGDPGAIMIGPDPDASTIHVNNNNISGNSPSGVTNKAAVTLDATNNYWGAADGPGVVGSGTGDKVSTNVLFNPWLTVPQTIQNICIPPNNPPVAQCKDVPVAAGPSCTANASIDNGSYDPDGDPITIAYSPAGPYSLGDTAVTLTVTDDKDASDSCTGTVTVVDNTKPTITSVSVSPSVLWPPNHKMVPVTVVPFTFDNCGATTCSIVLVTSNEPIDGLGDGDTSPDWQFIPGSLTANLRAERSGTGSGRIYTIGVRCSDASGNASSIGTTQVSVPHDQGKK